MQKLTIAIAVLALTTGAAMAQDVVRMGSEGAYPPYNFINDRNELDGFERELGDALCEKIGVTCEWVINDWDSIIPNLVSGNYDTIMAGMSITPEREQMIAFTQNYLLPEPSAYAALAGAGDEVMSGIVAAQTGTIQAGYVAETDATIVEFPTPDETIAAVRNGEVDAVMADKAFLIPFVDESAGEIEFLGEDIFIGGGVGMGVRQSDTALRERFDVAITEMKEDGSLNELITKWFGEAFPTF